MRRWLVAAALLAAAAGAWLAANPRLRTRAVAAFAGLRHEAPDPRPSPPPSGPAAPAVVAGDPRLDLDQSTVRPGADVAVRFAGIRNPSKQDWLSIFEAGAPATAYGQWHYLGARAEGVQTFTAPKERGAFEFRLFLDWPSGGYNAVAVSPTLRVEPEVPFVERPEPVVPLQIDKTTFGPGDEITVRFVTPGEYPTNAWVGIIPSHVKHGSEELNDQHDLSYRYLEGRAAGELTFQAPMESGEYDFRMNESDSGGREVASVTFSVVTFAADINGIWSCDDGATYHLRQIGDTLWWIGQPPFEARLPANVAFGTIRYDQIDLQMAEVPSSAMFEIPAEAPPGYRPMQNGRLILKIVSTKEIAAVEKPEAFRGRLWKR